MGNNSSFMLQDEEITHICEETGFSPAQVERLYSRFTTLDKSGNGCLSRQDCLAIPELAINPLYDRIVQMFFNDCDEDHERINFRQFMKVLATFRRRRPIKNSSTELEEPPNSAKQKLHFMFKLYDINNDDLIDLDDMISILKMMVGSYVDEDRVRMIAEKSLSEADKNCDGKVDFEEFCSAFAHKDIDELLRVRFNWL